MGNLRIAEAIASFSLAQGQNKGFDLSGQCLGFINRGEMPATRDDLKPRICDPRHNLALMLLDGVELIQFAGQKVAGS
jgi:hypothetical protein